MQDLLGEISSAVSSLSASRITPYLVLLEHVKQILTTATTTVVKPSKVHLVFRLGSAIPISVNPQNLELGFIHNLPVMEQQNV